MIGRALIRAAGSKAACAVLGAMALCAAASSAFAEPATGSRIEGTSGSGTMVWSDVVVSPGKGGEVKTNEASQRMRKIANCMATKHRKVAAAFLTVSPIAADYDEVGRAFYDKVQDCLSFYMGSYSSLEIRMPTLLLRGFIAEVFLHQWPRPNLAPMPSYRESYSAPWMADEPSNRVVEEMSFCMAEMHPAESIELLASPIGSTAQSAAVGKVMALVPKCLQNGATLKTDATGLRASIALGIYHRIVGRPPPAGAAAGVN